MINSAKNKGIVFIVTLMVMSVVFAVAGAYVSNAIVQNQSVVREVASAQQFYSSEKGMEYAYIESKNHNFNWFTHTVSSDSTLVKNNITPTATISGVSFNSSTGCYEVTVGSGKLEIKTYADPSKPSETLVLSRYTLNSVSQVEKMRISNKSLFRFFYYYPTDKYFGWMTLDGKNIGGVYVKGNIYMHGTTFNNLTELSTDTTHGILKYYYQYNAPYVLDGNRESLRDGKAALPPLASPHEYLSTNLYPTGSSWPPNDWLSVGYHFYYQPSGNYTTAVGTVNGVAMPVTLGTYWNWDKYSGTDKSALPSGSPEKDVQFYDKDGNLADQSAYWDPLYSWLTANASNAYTPGTAGSCYGKPSDCAANLFDSAFWPNKVYKRDSETIPVNYLNTKIINGQAADFDSWLNDSMHPERKPLVKVIQKYDLVIPPSISSDYITKAKNAGLYIGIKYVCSGGRASVKNSSPFAVVLETILNAIVPQAFAVAAPGGGGSCVPTYDVWLNGVNSSTLPIWITDNVKFFNTAYPHSSAVMESVMELDISKLLQYPDLVPPNGTVYIDTTNGTSKGIRIVNGSKLPDKGLTIVCPYSIYIKGDYNTDASWQPAAVITNNIIFILSNNFNDPQQLPATIYPRENGYEWRYVDLTNLVPGDTVKLTALEQQCKQFFGLSDSFDIHSAGKQPVDKFDLSNKIRYQYNIDYQDKMPNKAKNTTINAALASYYDIGTYQLERWSRESYSSVASFSYSLNLKGAFIRFGTQWAPAVSDAPGIANTVVRAGDKTMSPTTMQNGATLTVNTTPLFTYEDKFGDPKNFPNGDFSAASEGRWQEVSDFDHNVN